MKQYRIFLVLGGKATVGDNNYIWVKNLCDPLVALGHDVHLLNIDEYAQKNGLRSMSPEAKERLSNELPGLFLKEHIKKPFDLFFSYLHNVQIIPQVLLEIKKHVFTINYSTNYHQFDLYKEVASIVDYNIYISKIAKIGFDDLGVKSYWMPLGANPNFYQPSQSKNDSTVFIGSEYGPRANLFWRLLQYGINLKIYGQGWNLDDVVIPLTLPENKAILKRIVNQMLKNITGYELRNRKAKADLKLEDKLRVTYDDLNQTILYLLRRDYPANLHASLSDTNYVKVLSEAGIVINIQESRFNHDYYNHQVLFGSNLRDFEATMCGSCLITQHSEEIEEIFSIGNEVICYHDEHDLSEKIKHYSINTSQRDIIARAGYSRSKNDHTWERRFAAFFNILEI